jgi:uncharacterized membrane protein YkoI
MKNRMTSVVSLAATVALVGCNNSGPGSHFDPPNREFAGGLGITTPPPVTADQAMAIAATAAGGTAISLSQETEGRQLFYEVKVQTSSGDKEVEVRASDGGVVEIEAADND